MESIGEKLRASREEKAFSIEQAARETHIARRFIEAMEGEHFEIFPGESYLIGFLRNYSKYLELDAEEIISLYRNTQIQEQPAPVEELLDTRRTIRPGVVIAVIAAVVIIGGALTALSFLPDMQNRPVAPVDTDTADIAELRFNGEILEQEFTADSRIIIPMDGSEYAIEIREISSPVTLFVNDTPFSLGEGESGFLDMDQDGDPDIRIIFKSILNSGNPVLRFDKVIAGASTAAAGTDPRDNDEAGIPQGQTSEPTRVKNVQTITQAGEAAPFFVEAIFRGPVMFRYLADGQDEIEQYLNSGQRFQLEVTDYIYIWLSNAGKLQFTAAGQELRLGRDGEAAAYKIAWNENSLELIPLY
jgi:cytoskeleton protein RodZ